jgi:hypothetical protein
LARRFFASNIYTVLACERCQRQAESGEVGEPCPVGGCDGSLARLEVVPLSVARRWRQERNAADEKVERLHAELVDTLKLVD